jgi:hypothetical protein
MYPNLYPFEYSFHIIVVNNFYFIYLSIEKIITYESNSFFENVKCTLLTLIEE